MYLISILVFVTTCMSSPCANNTSVSSVPDTYATYYFRINEDIPGCVPVQNFDGVYGSCQQVYSSNSKYWAAVYGGSKLCGKKIEVSYLNLNTMNINTVILEIQDECPGCTDGHVDMGLEALIELTLDPNAACAIHSTLPKISWNLI